MVENPFYGSVEIGEFLKKLVKRSEGKWFFFNKKNRCRVYCLLYNKYMYLKIKEKNNNKLPNITLIEESIKLFFKLNVISDH